MLDSRPRDGGPENSGRYDQKRNGKADQAQAGHERCHQSGFVGLLLRIEIIAEQQNREGRRNQDGSRQTHQTFKAEVHGGACSAGEHADRAEGPREYSRGRTSVEATFGDDVSWPR